MTTPDAVQYAILYCTVQRVTIPDAVQYAILYCTVHRVTIPDAVQYAILYCTESDDTRCCGNTICSPEDGHVNARNMSGIVV